MTKKEAVRRERLSHFDSSLVITCCGINVYARFIWP